MAALCFAFYIVLGLVIGFFPIFVVAVGVCAVIFLGTAAVIGLAAVSPSIGGWIAIAILVAVFHLARLAYRGWAAAGHLPPRIRDSA